MVGLDRARQTDTKTPLGSEVRDLGIQKKGGLGKLTGGRKVIDAYTDVYETRFRERWVPAQTTPRTNRALKAGEPNTDETHEIKRWGEHWDTQDKGYKNRRATRRDAPKWT